MEQSADNRTMEKLLRQQAALAAFGMFAFREKHLANILNEAARICAESLGVPFAKICRYRKDSNDLLIEAGVGWQPGVVGVVTCRADETSPQGRAFITGEPIIIKNLEHLNNLELPAFYPAHGIVSSIDVLIQNRSGEPYGVLEVDSPHEHAYDEHDINFLTGFTNVLAEAVATVERTEKLRQALAVKDALIAEKNTLAAELQHRVRNNLQVVYSMLTSENVNADGPPSPAIAVVARRVMTIAKVYDHLLGTGLTRTIDFGAYMKSLCDTLPETQSPIDAAIKVVCDTDALILDLDTVTALGMVVAELIANSYKHAFPERRGTIAVTLRHAAGTSEATLTISDDGICLPAKIESKRQGLGLARRLMEQVAGTILPRTAAGTAWELRFPVAAMPQPAE